jgi:hypothetical protein
MPNRRIPTLVEYRDSSGNGHDGTVIGAEWTGGILGSALDFDGVDDYVLCAERTGNGPGVYPEQDIVRLSLWFYGDSANTADRMFVALNGTAVVYHEDAAATQLSGWNEWVIDLTEFGIDMTNVDSITVGIGTKNAPAPTGGTGTMYFDDIRLIR